MCCLLHSDFQTNAILFDSRILPHKCMHYFQAKTLSPSLWSSSQKECAAMCRLTHTHCGTAIKCQSKQCEAACHQDFLGTTLASSIPCENRSSLCFKILQNASSRYFLGLLKEGLFTSWMPSDLQPLLWLGSLSCGLAAFFQLG